MDIFVGKSLFLDNFSVMHQSDVLLIPLLCLLSTNCSGHTVVWPGSDLCNGDKEQRVSVFVVFNN